MPDKKKGRISNEFMQFRFFSKKHIKLVTRLVFTICHYDRRPLDYCIWWCFFCLAVKLSALNAIRVRLTYLVAADDRLNGQVIIDHFFVGFGRARQRATKRAGVLRYGHMASLGGRQRWRRAVRIVSEVGVPRLCGLTKRNG